MGLARTSGLFGQPSPIALGILLEDVHHRSRLADLGRYVIGSYAMKTFLRTIFAPPRRGGTASLAALIGLCAAIEGLFQLSDHGLLIEVGWRPQGYLIGAFWPEPDPTWFPLFPGQSIAMYLTYGFLHVGAAHLLLNMVMLWVLGAAALERVGAASFLVLYAGAAVAGGAVFALLSFSSQPMVGASGAIFGLIAAVTAWRWEDAVGSRNKVRAILPDLGVVIVVSLLVPLVLPGVVAWQTHLGGFLAGWVLAIALDPGTSKT